MIPFGALRNFALKADLSSERPWYHVFEGVNTVMMVTDPASSVILPSAVRSVMQPQLPSAEGLIDDGIAQLKSCWLHSGCFRISLRQGLELIVLYTFSHLTGFIFLPVCRTEVDSMVMTPTVPW
jgi:hypothetical protein